MKILTQAKDHAFHLNNLAMDYQKDGRDFLAEDLRLAALIIRTLSKLVELEYVEKGQGND